MRSLFVILFLFLGMGYALEAQNLHITYFTETRGLPSNQVRHVAHDEFGFVWIACDGGLVRFDGLEFTDYSQQIPSQYGRYFCPTDEGLLFSHDAGISLIKPALDTAHITSFMDASIDPEANALYYPSRLFRQQNGDIWISGPGGRISRIRGDERTELLPESEDQEDENNQAFFAELDQGIIAIAFTSGGLYVYDDSSQCLQRIYSFSRVNDLKSNGNELWIAGNNVQRIELSENGLRVQDRETFYTNLGEVTTLALHNQVNIFLGIKDKGLYYLDKFSERVKT